MVSMLSPVTGANPTANSTPADKLRAQATDLEGVFLNTLMSQMFSSLDSRGKFGGGFAEETWRGMQAEQYSTAIAQSGGVGLADQLVSQLLQVQQSSPQGGI